MADTNIDINLVLSCGPLLFVLLGMALFWYFTGGNK